MKQLLKRIRMAFVRTFQLRLKACGPSTYSARGVRIRPGTCSIGRETFIGPECWLAVDDLRIENFVMLAGRVAIVGGDPRRIGLSLHHAFGYGLPAVVFDNRMRHGPEFEVLVSGRNAIIVKEDDLNELADALCSLLSDPELSARLGRNGRETILREYTVEPMVDNFTRAIARAHERAVARQR